MMHRRRRSNPDLFSWLLIVVLVGMSLTVGYQVSLYYIATDLPMATRPVPSDDVGG